MENHKLKILVRADGDNRIGMGHIIRTMALAKEFMLRNCEVIYFVKEYNVVIDLLKENGFNTININCKTSLDKEIEIIEQVIIENKIDIFIGDAKHINQYYLNRVEHKCSYLVLIDVLGDMSIGADIIINGGIYVEQLEIKAKEYNRNTLLGTNYSLLREQFYECRQRHINRKVNNILITMGGADILELTPKILKYICDFNEELSIDVVVGYACCNKHEIEKVAYNKTNINLYYNVTNMAELMYKCDLAISAGGTTLYELAATGTPTIGIIQVENQILQTTKFEEKGLIINLGNGNELTKTKFLYTFKSLSNNYKKRKEMSKLGQMIIDGKGAKRCVDKILYEFVTKKNNLKKL